MNGEQEMDGTLPQGWGDLGWCGVAAILHLETEKDFALKAKVLCDLANGNHVEASAENGSFLLCLLYICLSDGRLQLALNSKYTWSGSIGCEVYARPTGGRGKQWD
jgi:hypothetical protein